MLTGPPGVTGFAGGRPKVEEIVAYWPALIPKEEIKAKRRINRGVVTTLRRISQISFDISHLPFED